jgi:hypothetical protein
MGARFRGPVAVPINEEFRDRGLQTPQFIQDLSTRPRRRSSIRSAQGDVTIRSDWRFRIPSMAVSRGGKGPTLDRETRVCGRLIRPTTLPVRWLMMDRTLRQTAVTPA